MIYYCTFEPTDKPSEYACSKCGFSVRSKFDLDQIRRNCRVSDDNAQYTKHGVGTELQKLIAQMGQEVKQTCNCSPRILAMNIRGIAWCVRHKKRIIDWLQEAASEQGIISYRTAVTLHTVGAWRHCVKVQLLQPAIAAAKLDPLAKL